TQYLVGEGGVGDLGGHVRSSQVCSRRSPARPEVFPAGRTPGGSVAETDPVEVDVVGRLAAGQRDVDGVGTGHRADVGRYQVPALPAAGVRDGEAAQRRRARTVQAHLDQAGDAARGARGGLRLELRGRGTAEVHAVEPQEVTVAAGADERAGVRQALQLVGGLGLDGAVRVPATGRRVGRPTGR